LVVVLRLEKEHDPDFWVVYIKEIIYKIINSLTHITQKCQNAMFCKLDDTLLC